MATETKQKKTRTTITRRKRIGTIRINQINKNTSPSAVTVYRVDRSQPPDSHASGRLSQMPLRATAQA